MEGYGSKNLALYFHSMRELKQEEKKKRKKERRKEQVEDEDEKLPTVRVLVSSR